MTLRNLPNYSMSYDLDDGSVMAIDIAGHGHDLDLVEFLIDFEELEGGFDVSESWRRTIPTTWEGEPVMMHHYQSFAASGATPVTHVEVAVPTYRWCVNHPYEPWRSGVHQSQVIDGETLVEDELARIAGRVDPRPTVDERGYIYMCAECSDSFRERQMARRRELAEARS